MNTLAKWIDAINERLGQLVSWLALFMVLVTTYSVLLRYALAQGLPWQQELVRYMHGILFLGGAAYAFKHDALVRVDVLYQQMSEHRKAWVNIIGTICFLYPVCFSLIYFSWGYVLNSWGIMEGSAEYKGMPGVFLFKSFIWVCAVTVGMQGLSTIIHSISVLQNKEQVPPEDVHV